MLWNAFPFWSLEMTWGRFVWDYFESPPRCHVLRFFRQDSFDFTFGFRRWASEILVRDMSAGGALNLPNCKRFRYLNIQHLTVLFLESCFHINLFTLIYCTSINYILFFNLMFFKFSHTIFNLFPVDRHRMVEITSNLNWDLCRSRALFTLRLRESMGLLATWRLELCVLFLSGLKIFMTGSLLIR